MTENTIVIENANSNVNTSANNARRATWHNIGTDVSKATCVEEVLEAAKLNYTVEAEKLTTESGIIVPNFVSTVAKYDDGSSRYLGTVGNNFTICQNHEAFDFVNEIHDDLKFVKAGETYNGLVYVIGELPSMEILGDTVTPHVILQNGHNGRHQLKSTIVPLRIVCQNQFNVSFKESPNTISIVHSSLMSSKLQAAKNLLSGAAEYMNTFKANAEFLANVKCGREACMKIIEDFFKKDVKIEELKPAQLIKLEEKIARMKNAYLAEDNANFEGTAYGLVNGMTDYLTHKDVRPSDKSEDSKFLTVTFDPTALSAFTSFVLERTAA